MPAATDPLRRGLGELEDLVDNWEERTLNCNYAEVNNDLLGNDRKADLLIEAKKNALMTKDQGAVRRVCKRDPEQVRLVVGLDSKIKEKTGVPTAFSTAPREVKKESSLIGADRLIRQGLDRVDPDNFEDYVEAQEAWLQAISAVDASSYASGAADIGAIISSTTGDSQFLDETRKSVVKARDALRIIVAILSD